MVAVRRGLVIVAIVGLITAHATSANAAALSAFGTQFPASAEPDPFGGSVIANLLVNVTAPTFTGSLSTQVIEGDTSNPFSGGLTFTFLLTNDETSAHPMGRLTVNGYDGWLTDTSYQFPGPGTAPAFINRPVADVVGFSFLDLLTFSVLDPGSSSALLVIQTNAPSYTEDSASVIDGFVATVPTLAPVPEPATLALLGASAMALMIRRRR